MFNFFLSLIILYSKVFFFCFFVGFSSCGNEVITYGTIKINKNPDNINRYFSSLGRFASLREILQNNEGNILLFTAPGCGR